MSKLSFNVKPKNPEQRTALEYLTDPNVDLVVLEGVAGSGKTYLAISAGLGQILEYKTYKEIIFTRAPVALGADMGYLPGGEADKLGPWCGALFDNLDSLTGDNEITRAFIQSKISIKAMQFMRGRSLVGKYLVIDEAQNMTPNELKVLISRAGEGTKVVVLGDISQIDNKRITAESNALSYIKGSIEFMPRDFVKIISLPVSERSRLCNWASLAL